MFIEVGVTALVAATAHYGRYIPDALRQLSRNGLNISGPWRMEHLGEPTDGRGLENKWRTDIEMKQLGQIIRGTATARSENPDLPTVISSIEGRFISNYLDVVFRDKDSCRLNRSVFLLAVADGGRALKGFRVFAGRDLNFARAVECKWTQARADGTDCYKA